jgi:hypothetical protein
MHGVPHRAARMIKEVSAAGNRLASLQYDAQTVKAGKAAAPAAEREDHSWKIASALICTKASPTYG